MPDYGSSYNSLRIYSKYYYIWGGYILEKMWKDSNSGYYRFRVINPDKNMLGRWVDIYEGVAANAKILGLKKDYSEQTLKVLYGEFHEQ